jgi:hypothetical protein
MGCRPLRDTPQRRPQHRIDDSLVIAFLTAASIVNRG